MDISNNITIHINNIFTKYLAFIAFGLSLGFLIQSRAKLYKINSLRGLEL